MVRPNIVVLRELHSLPAAQKLFAMLADQTDLNDWITVDELIDALAIGRRNAVDLLRELAEAGVGEFRLGRKGHPSRLVWSTDPRPLVSRVLGRDSKSPDTDALELAAPTPRLFAVEAGQADREQSDNPAMVEHVFVLRPDLRVEISLPVDLTVREAAALGEWVRNLSFER